MKAVCIHKHPTNPALSKLVYEQSVDKPEPSPGEILVRIHATTLTRDELGWDIKYQPRGPFPIPGLDVSGTVAAVGSDLTNDHTFKIGQEVFGFLMYPKDGACAEYAIAQPEMLGPKPQNIDFESAAAMPLSALTAYQALFDHGGLKSGQKVLITGAAGGVGVYAVQLAKWAGAHVIGTASGGKEEFVKSLGADEVVDYTKTAFENVVRDVDVVLDTVGGETLEKAWKTVKEGGTLTAVAAAPATNQQEQHPTVKYVWFIVKHNREQLDVVKRLVEEGKVKPVVDRVMEFEKAAEAYALAMKARTRGKIVLSVLKVVD